MNDKLMQTLIEAIDVSNILDKSGLEEIIAQRIRTAMQR